MIMIFERCLRMFDLDGHERSAAPNLLAGSFFFNKTLNFCPTSPLTVSLKQRPDMPSRFLIHTVDIEGHASRSSLLQSPQNACLMLVSLKIFKTSASVIIPSSGTTETAVCGHCGFIPFVVSMRSTIHPPLAITSVLLLYKSANIKAAVRLTTSPPSADTSTVH